MLGYSHSEKENLHGLSCVPNMQILAERATLYDYELIVGDNGKRVLAFGKFAGRAGLIDFLHGLGKRMGFQLLTCSPVNYYKPVPA